MNFDALTERRAARIMMVDDHPIVREGMALFLNAQQDLELCWQAGDANEALAMMARADPALIVVDISLNKDSGLDLIHKLRRLDPSVPILVLSMHDESVFAERALQAGANGYLMKQEATRGILQAVRTVLAGEIYLSPAMHSNLANRLQAAPRQSAHRLAGLTEREFEVLHLIGLGYGTRQISEKLCRSIKTIESHRASLRDKLSLDSAADLMRFATRWVDGRA